VLNLETELHHGEYGHSYPVSMIEVVGTGLTDTIGQTSAALGFTQIGASNQSFVTASGAAGCPSPVV